MRRIGKNAFTEVYFWGCNPSFVVTNDGVVMIDTPQQPIDSMRWRETIMEHGPIRYLINTEPHGDHISGNCYFQEAEVVAQEGLKTRYEQAMEQMLSEERVERMKETNPDSVWLLNHPDYPPHPPTRTFDKEMTLKVGNHTFECIHVPGHTKPQTAIYVPEEGVVFTGDNIFFKCKTFIQEADPWEWLDALKTIDSLDVDVIAPGHGETCDKQYLKQQAQIIESWLGVVQDFVRRGLTEEEALQQPLEVRQLDPYPIGQRLYAMSDRLNGMNVANIYRQVKARQEAGR
jgi:cyclase